MSDNNILEQKKSIVIKLHNLGFNFVPAGTDKKPSVKWKSFQSEKILNDQMVLWSNKFTNCNWLMLTGYNSEGLGLVFVDCDDDEAIAWAKEHLPDTPIKQQTRRGLHLGYRCPAIPVGNRAKLAGHNIDVRGLGGYIVAPGSIRDDGTVYTWSAEWTKEEILKAPVFDINWFPSLKPTPDTVKEQAGRAYLSQCPGTQVGVGSCSGQVIKHCHKLFELALSKEQALKLLIPWGAKPDNLDEYGNYYPWTEAELAHKLDFVAAGLLASGNKIDTLALSSMVEKFDFEPLDVIEPEFVEPVRAKRFLTRKDLKNMPRQTFLVDQHIPNNSIVGLVGASGEKKTFFALDMALAISTGAKALDKYSTSKGKVLYIIGEGVFGIDKRISAWETARGIDAEITFLNEQCDLAADATAENILDDYRHEIGGQPVLIVLDTLNKLFGGGDENSTKDMSKFVRSCETLRQKSGASVMIVHHLGKNEAAGARGANALLCALDVEIRLSDGEVKFSKVKDFAAPDNYSITHEKVADSLVLSTGYGAVSDTELDIIATLSSTKGKSKADICNITGLSDKTIRRHLSTLEKSARIRVSIDHEGKKIYALPTAL